jgi:hypothetical protein
VCVCARTAQVSHDQMRDHVWSMLRPKHMLKWRQRHVIDYTFSFSKEQFFPLEPRPYTPCVQEVRPGVWLLPSTERVVDAERAGFPAVRTIGCCASTHVVACTPAQNGRWVHTVRWAGFTAASTSGCSVSTRLPGCCPCGCCPAAADGV